MQKRSSCIVLWSVMLLVAAPCTSQWAFEVVVGDQTSGIHDNGFGSYLNESVYSMAGFNGSVYAGTYKLGRVYRSSNGTTWSLVNSDGFGDTHNDYAMSMAVFGSYLYVGTGHWDGCEIWRSSNGTTWTQVVGESAAVNNGFGDNTLDNALSMAVYNNTLYVGTWGQYGCEVWRSGNGTSWTKSSLYGFDEDINNYSANDLEVFAGNLYAGSDKCKVWRYDGGTDWTQVNTTQFGDGSNNRVTRLAVFENRLYAGTHNINGCQVWRTGNGTTWGRVVNNGFGDSFNDTITSMAVVGEHLFVATYNGSGTEVWVTNDGSNWMQLNRNGFGDVENEEALAMTAFDGSLYVGTTHISSTYGGCEVWRSSPILIDGFETGDTSHWTSSTN